MAPQTLPAFTPGRPAAAVDAALRQSLALADEARRCAVLWFAEVQRRELWRALGHATLELYAVHALGFSRNRYWQFKRLADDLDRLPALHVAVSEGSVGWTKAQQVARVATPASEAGWVERARQCGRRELAAAVTAEVARVRVAARAVAAPAASQAPAGGGAGQLAFALEAPGATAASTAAPTADLAIPASVTLRADALQVARFEALVERARKRGLVPAQAGRMDLVLAALEQLVDGGVPHTDGHDVADAVAAGGSAPAPRRESRASAQVVVHRCPACAAATVTTAGGERPLAPAQIAALGCDAIISQPGRPNRATIPPRTRRAVLARDRHRCATPGCGATAFLEVHHVVPRSWGGSNQATNLVTLCTRCHAFTHDTGVAPEQCPAGSGPR